MKSTTTNREVFFNQLQHFVFNVTYKITSFLIENNLGIRQPSFFFLFKVVNIQLRLCIIFLTYKQKNIFIISVKKIPQPT